MATLLPARPAHAWRDRSNRFALASLVLGAAGIPLYFLWGVPSLLAVISGLIALRQIERSRGQQGARQGGRVLALAGLTLGGVAYVVTVVAMMTFGLATLLSHR